VVGTTLFSCCIFVAAISTPEGLASPLFIIGRAGFVYAIIRDRGMQYRVEKGQKLTVSLMDAEPGSQVDLDEVLFVGGEQPQVGTPLVNGAKVRAEVLRNYKGEKIIVFRYRNKKRYRRRTGHRQEYTELKIAEILV
jgi:large subunit ribosomal protein L21